MKILNVIYALFLTLTLFGQRQETVYVEEWVKAPSQEELQKPLVILDFWATWCVPCLQAMPETERLMEGYDNDVLLVYNSEEPSLTVSKFMEKKGKNFFSAVDTKGRNIDLFQVSSLPTTIVLDPDGNIIWRGYPTDLNSKLMDKLIKQYKGTVGSPYRFSVDDPKKTTVEENFLEFKSKGIEIEFTPSTAESNFLEDLQPHFYFNGKLENLVSFLYDIPQKNVSNLSDNQDYYTLKCTYDDPEKFRKAIEKFIKNELKIDIQSDAEMKETYVLSPSDELNFYDTNVYDFSENQAQYLASDMEVEIDNASVNEMIKVLNNFSELNFEADGFDNKAHDWSVHFKYNQFTLEQLEHDYHFNLSKDQRLVQSIKITDK